MEVFYDGRCGMCCTFIEWLNAQEKNGGCEVVCLDYRGDGAREVFPDLAEFHPEKEMVVRVNGVEVYQGGEGWVCCLWSCAKYKEVAERVNGSVLLPMAKKMCHLISRNRFAVSKLFFRKKHAEIAREIEEAEMLKGTDENEVG